MTYRLFYLLTVIGSLTIPHTQAATPSALGSTPQEEGWRWKQRLVVNIDEHAFSLEERHTHLSQTVQGILTILKEGDMVALTRTGLRQARALEISMDDVFYGLSLKGKARKIRQVIDQESSRDS